MTKLLIISLCIFIVSTIYFQYKRDEFENENAQLKSQIEHLKKELFKCNSDTSHKYCLKLGK